MGADEKELSQRPFDRIAAEMEKHTDAEIRQATEWMIDQFREHVRHGTKCLGEIRSYNPYDFMSGNPAEAILILHDYIVTEKLKATGVGSPLGFNITHWIRAQNLAMLHIDAILGVHSDKTKLQMIMEDDKTGFDKFVKGYPDWPVDSPEKKLLVMEGLARRNPGIFPTLHAKLMARDAGLTEPAPAPDAPKPVTRPKPVDPMFAGMTRSERRRLQRKLHMEIN